MTDWNCGIHLRGFDWVELRRRWQALHKTLWRYASLVLCVPCMRVSCLDCVRSAARVRVRVMLEFFLLPDCVLSLG